MSNAHIQANGVIELELFLNLKKLTDPKQKYFGPA